LASSGLDVAINNAGMATIARNLATLVMSIPSSSSILHQSHRSMMAHSSGWTGGADDALFGAGGCAVVAIVASARFRPSGGLLTFPLGPAIAGLRTRRVVLAGPTPQERAIDGPAV